MNNSDPSLCFTNKEDHLINYSFHINILVIFQPLESFSDNSCAHCSIRLGSRHSIQVNNIVDRVDPSSRSITIRILCSSIPLYKSISLFLFAPNCPNCDELLSVICHLLNYPHHVFYKNSFSQINYQLPTIFRITESCGTLNEQVLSSTS